MLSDDQLDAGIAEVAYAAVSNPERSKLAVSASHEAGLLATVHAVLVNRKLTPIQKCLLMLLAWDGVRTAEQLGEVFDISSKSVQYSMRNLIKWGVVVTDLRPDYTKQEFVRVYELNIDRLEGSESDAE